MPTPVPLFDVEPLLPALQRNELILTPNQRMASRIRAAYAMMMAAQGNEVVAKPRVYSLSEWQQRCWDDLLLRAYVPLLALKPLSASQEQSLWQQIVLGSDSGAALLKPAATAQRAASAYRLLVDWQLAFSAAMSDQVDAHLRARLSDDEDARELLRWVDLFEQRCKAEQWLPAARIPEQLMTAFANGTLVAEPVIHGVHFEDIPPLQTALIASAGPLQSFQPPQQPGKTQVVACEHFRQEISAAALWAKSRLTDHAARVAIVVPDLSQQRNLVQRILQEVFDRDYKLPQSDQNSAPAAFNMSAGYPLAEAPVISAAMNALSLTMPKLALETYEDICRSPFYALDNSDQHCLDQLVRLLRREQQFELSTARFRQLAERSGTADQAWPFARRLQQLAGLVRAQKPNAARSIVKWLEFIGESLNTLGWPGKRSLSSVEYQQVSQWQQVLQELHTLSTVRGKLSFNDVLAELRSLLAAKIFQPQTVDAPLQILGVLEAVGLSFSDIWLCSMSEQHWPNAPSPHPLLPYGLQRELRMPNASAERELVYASQISHKLLCSAGQVVVSFPTMVDDNPAAVSSLFQQQPIGSLKELLGEQFAQLAYQPGSAQSAPLETFEAGHAPPLQQPLTAGTGLLASQSLCPFIAFARYRLNLQALPEPELGISPADRGTLVHAAMERFWFRAKTRQQLLDFSAEELSAAIDAACSMAMSDFIQRGKRHIGKRLQALEQQRMVKLLNRWLEQEQARQEFTALHLEYQLNLDMLPLTLSMRIDRIDQLADGSLLVIDYKTGQSSVNRWWGDRPEEPQLPAYNLMLTAQQQRVSGIAFAELRADQVAFKGVAEQDSAEPLLSWQEKYSRDSGVEDWPQLQQHWQTVIEGLAQEFIQGVADVDASAVTSLRAGDYLSLMRTGLTVQGDKQPGVAQ